MKLTNFKNLFNAAFNKNKIDEEQGKVTRYNEADFIDVKTDVDAELLNDDYVPNIDLDPVVSKQKRRSKYKDYNNKGFSYDNVIDAEVIYKDEEPKNNDKKSTQTSEDDAKFVNAEILSDIEDASLNNVVDNKNTSSNDDNSSSNVNENQGTKDTSDAEDNDDDDNGDVNANSGDIETNGTDNAPSEEETSAQDNGTTQDSGTNQDSENTSTVDENNAEVVDEVVEEQDNIDKTTDAEETEEMDEAEDIFEEDVNAILDEEYHTLEGIIDDVFPATLYKDMVKERDRKILGEFLYAPDRMKKDDKNGNRILTILCAVPTVAYLSVVATSVVALPPVAMGVIGFGIAGGMVAGANYITGQNSILGSIYRKVRTRFGKANPRVNLNEYKEDYENLKNELNDNLISAAKVRDTNVANKDNFEKVFTEHFDKIFNGEESNVEFGSGEAKKIFDELTEDCIDFTRIVGEDTAKVEALANEKEELNIFVDVCKEFSFSPVLTNAILFSIYLFPL